MRQQDAQTQKMLKPCRNRAHLVANISHSGSTPTQSRPDFNYKDIYKLGKIRIYSEVLCKLSQLYNPNQYKLTTPYTPNYY